MPPNPAESASRNGLLDRNATAILLGLALVGALLLYVQHVRGQDRIIYAAATHSAQAYATTLADFRALYSEKVVQPARAAGMVVTHDYEAIEGAIPLPNALSLEFGHRYGDLKSDIYSPYPFPQSKTGAGLKDAFQRDAWAFLREHPDQSFQRFEVLDGVYSLRYATADRMQPSCVDCHNSAPETPRSDWKVGDVAGILEVVVPVPPAPAITGAARTEAGLTLLTIAIIGALIVGLAIVQLRRAAAKQQALQATLARSRARLTAEIARRQGVQHQLLAAKEDAARVADAKARFLSTLSHDIRTPLDAILGHVHVLGRTDLDRDQQAAVDAIANASEGLFGTINDILAYAKVPTDEVEIEAGAVHVRECVEQASDAVAPLAQAKGLEYAVIVRADVPDRIIGDAGRLGQILVNLGTNATKFTERGHILIRVEPAGEHLRFEVEDTGIGIPAAQLPTLFDRLIPTDVPGLYPGSGLGLAISKRLAEAMNGRMGARSVEGAGTTLWVEVPCRRIPTPTARVEGAETLRTVVAYPRPLSAEALAQELRHQGVVDIQSAHTAAELREALRGSPDLVFLSLALAEAVPEAIAELPRAGAQVLLLASPPQRRALMELARERDLACDVLPVRAAWIRKQLMARLGLMEAADVAVDPKLAARRGNYRILIAEDSEVNRLFVIRLLELAGYTEIAVADNGREALEAWRRYRPDLILMDWQMPGMDGLEATTRIRTEEAKTGSHTPILALTATAMEGDREQCLKAGMDDYLAKPFVLSEFVRRLDRFLLKPAR